MLRLPLNLNDSTMASQTEIGNVAKCSQRSLCFVRLFLHCNLAVFGYLTVEVLNHSTSDLYQALGHLLLAKSIFFKPLLAGSALSLLLGEEKTFYHEALKLHEEISFMDSYTHRNTSRSPSAWLLAIGKTYIIHDFNFTGMSCFLSPEVLNLSKYRE